jgi:hypothetical protein
MAGSTLTFRSVYFKALTKRATSGGFFGLFKFFYVGRRRRRRSAKNLFQDPFAT